MTPQTPGERIVDIDRRLKTVEDKLEDLAKREAATTEFITDHKATERERDKQQALRHVENTTRLEEINAKISRRSLVWTIAGVMVAFASLFIGGLAIVVMVKVAHSDIHSIMPISTSEPVFSRSLPADAHAGPSHY